MLIRDAGITQPPVDVDILARLLGVSFHPLDSGAGYTIYSGEGSPQVFRARGQPVWRSNLAAASGLTYVIRWVQEGVPFDSRLLTRTPRQVRLDQEYTLRLLMPMHLMHDWRRDTFDDIDILSRIFMVSPEMVAWGLNPVT